MKRFLLVLILGILTIGCMNSSDDEDTPKVTSPNTSPIDNTQDPTTSDLLEMAPTDGKLSADLMPPTDGKLPTDLLPPA